MTKTLTEQWRDGTLKGGIYYLLLKDGTTVTDETVYIVGEKQLRWHCSSFDFVKEVLAPVPSYDKWKQAKENIDKNGTWYTERSYKLIEKKLDIAVNALEWYSDYTNSTKGVFNMKPEKEAQEALKQIKELDK